MTSGGAKRRRWATALLVAVSLCALPWFAASAIFVVANGLTFSSLALSASACALVALLLAVRARTFSRVLAGVLTLSCAIDAAYVAVRLSRPREVGAIRYCEEGRCDARSPLLSRLVAEQDTVRAGLLLSSVTGALFPGEEAILGPALERSYARHESSPGFRDLPNAVLISERGYLAYVPEGAARAPCIVFLHGFGGQLSVYVEALIDGRLEDFVVLAPFGDVSGRFDVVGNDAVRDLVKSHLPREVDPGRVYLLGLSNGAVSASRLVEDPAMRRLFAGAVLLVGSDAPGARRYGGFPVLLVAGERDPRFPLDSIRSDAEALEAQGAQVRWEAIPGDHFILLTQSHSVARAVRAFVSTSAMP